MSVWPTASVALQMSLAGRHGGLTVVHGGGNALLQVSGQTAATASSLTRQDGLAWADDGFAAGQTVRIAGENVENDQLKDLVRWAERHSPVGRTVRHAPANIVSIVTE